MTDIALTLIAVAGRAQDQSGIWRGGSRTEREVFARLDSVDRGEFFAAGESGLRPEYRFTVNACEYAGETLCRYNGTEYAVYRTYQVPGSDALELYAQRKGGLNGGT